MEARQLASSWVRGAWVLALWLLVPGCVTTQPWINGDPAAAPISEVNAFWESRIHVTQDTVNGGRPLAGLAGRLYLFGPDLGHTLKGDGKVAIDLFDVTHAKAGVPPKRLERWEFDQASLNKLYRKDPIGWGYTLFLPWSTMRPDITQVQLNVCYTPAKGTPLYAEPATVSLRTQATLTHTRQVATK